jgi:hypothetical protein
MNPCDSKNRCAEPHQCPWFRTKLRPRMVRYAGISAHEATQHLIHLALVYRFILMLITMRRLPDYSYHVLIQQFCSPENQRILYAMIVHS